MNPDAKKLLLGTPLVPVVTLHNVDDAVPLATALVEGGLPLLEVTLRTPQALEAIARVRAEVEGVIVGAGTVINRTDLDNAIAAGSEFVMTPGSTTDLLAAGTDGGVPFYPGVATASDVINCLEYGLDTLKLFPAEASGGVSLLNALSAPFPQVSFIPTGGINSNNAPEYLRLDNVLSVGGSWVAPQALIEQGDWDAISQLAKAAHAVCSPTES